MVQLFCVIREIEMNRFALIAILLFALFIPVNAFAATSCESRELVVVELDLIDGHEIFKVNEHPVKEGEAFNEFFKNCAKKTAVLASTNARISQILDILVFLGKIGLPAGKENLFVFSVAPSSGAMTYFGTFATIKLTKEKDQLLKIIEHPPEQSNWL